MNELKKAKELLMIGDYTCVLVKASVVYSSGERGVAPLLKLIGSGNDYKGLWQQMDYQYDELGKNIEASF